VHVEEEEKKKSNVHNNYAVEQTMALALMIMKTSSCLL
jgi:hypothetical protein